MSAVDLVAGVLFVVGGFFFLAGTMGMVRFPDLYTRLHAATKADNLGLGFVTMGLVVSAPSPTASVDLFAVWLFVLASSGVAAQLIARHARCEGIAPWREP